MWFSLFTQLLSRLTKLSWFDVDKTELVFRTITDDVGKFLQVSLIRKAKTKVEMKEQY